MVYSTWTGNNDYWVCDGCGDFLNGKLQSIRNLIGFFSLRKKKAEAILYRRKGVNPFGKTAYDLNQQKHIHEIVFRWSTTNVRKEFKKHLKPLR